HLGTKDVELPQRLRRILNFTDETLEGGEFSGVTDLSAAFSVEGRLVEQDLDRIADLCVLDPRAVLDDREDYTFAFVAGVAGELGRDILLGEVGPDVIARFRD